MTRPFTVIAHRGASGYLPEHTLEGAAMAHAMHVDYIEQDVVLTRDNVLIVLHDLFLDAVTDVATRYPGRQRADGKHYAIDFSWQEIRSLQVHERLAPDGSAMFPDRFPASTEIFRIPSMAQMIGLIQGLNQSTGRNVGFYIEPKSPAFHGAAGKDVMAEILRLLSGHGLERADDPVFLQSFDMSALQRARREFGSQLKLVQLIGDNAWNESAADFDYLQTPAGLASIADFANGIGPWLPQLIAVDAAGAICSSGLAEEAHRHGLFVHGYTLRADQLPTAVADIETALRILIEMVGLDGVFTDHPDQVNAILGTPFIPCPG